MAIQYKHATARKERSNDFKRRVFCRCSDKRYIATLDKGKEKVLLCFVETMNFVDKQHFGLLLEKGIARADNALNVVFSGVNCGELKKFCTNGICINSCERCLS